MNNQKKLLIATLIVIDILLTVSILPFLLPVSEKINPVEIVNLKYSIFASITFSKNGKIVYEYSGLDPLTNLGLNLTFAKLSGSSTYNLTTYNMNTTYVSLGNYTTAMNGDTVALSGEFIRVSGTIHAQVYNGFNVTGIFQNLAGTNSSNCMGLNYESASIGQNDLFGYLTFGLVTGIDSTFIITAEIQIQGTTS